MIEFVTAFLLWLLVFMSSSIIASLTAKNFPRRAVYTMQLAMLFLSLAMIQLSSLKGSGFVPDFGYVIPASILGFGTSLILNLIEETPSTPEFLPEGRIPRLFLLLLLAPLSEEVLNRGLVEGYLLGYGHLWSAILFPALLFALPHAAAFDEDGVSVMGGAFLLGLLTGYLFALGGIIPAFIAHSSANLAGVLNLRKRPGYK